MTPDDFIAAIAPSAQAAATTTDIPASFVVAQAALESAWGESKLARQGFNLFGVKADGVWKGNVLTMPTREFVAGKWITVQAQWRKYGDWRECIEDHAAFLHRNPRYKLAFVGERSGSDFARQIAAAGYATDPLYGEKIVSVIRAHNLDALDTKGA